MEASRVKSGLERWREVVLHVNSLLSWEKDWYPAVVAAMITFKFIFLWYWEPNLISLLALQGIFLSTFDYFGPKILAQVYKSESWTGEKEKKFDQVCHDIETVSEHVCKTYKSYKEFKDNKPVMHFASVFMALLTLAWIGSTFNNLFLFYMTCLTIFMLPGLYRKGLLKKYFAQITLKMAEIFKGKDHLKKAE